MRAPLALAGGETIKQSAGPVRRMIDALRAGNICRHSYCIAIGGGAFLDAAGLAAALFHRGVRLVRVPTTALAQCDSGVGVKNAINYAGSKNLLGTFAPPYAVLNDADFLDALPLPLLLDGIAEAIKVAAIKDAAFFRSIERAAPRIRKRDLPVIRRILKRCALLHLDHIATSGDPYELGTARPLDYGHWAAHKLEAALEAPHLAWPCRRHRHRPRRPLCRRPRPAARTPGHPPRRNPPRPAACPSMRRNCPKPIAAAAWKSSTASRSSAPISAANSPSPFPSPLGSRVEIHAVDEALMADCIARLARWK